MPARRAAALTPTQKVFRESASPRAERNIALPVLARTNFGRPALRYARRAMRVASPTGTTRSLDPLPRTRTTASSVSSAWSSKLHNSETRRPDPYINSSIARSRNPCGVEVSGATTSRTASSGESMPGSLRRMRGLFASSQKSSRRNPERTK